MTLIAYPQTFDELVKSQSKPFLGLLIVGLLLIILKRVINNPRLNWVKPIDLFPVFAIIAIPLLTIDRHGNSFLPFLICLWMIIGIVWIIYQLGSTGELVLKRFLIAFWRFGDLYWLFFYVASFIIKILE